MATESNVKYKFVKEIKSTTKVKGWFVKINDVNYTIQSAPMPRLYTEVSAYVANKQGYPENLSNPLFRMRGDNLQEGVDKLIELITNKTI